MRKITSIITAFVLMVSLISVGITASASDAVPLVWDFSDSDDGWAKATGQGSSENNYEAENHRITISILAGWGTAGIYKDLDPNIDGSKYGTIKLTMAKYPVADLNGYVAFGSDLDNDANWVNFTLPATGDYLEVELDMTGNANWTGNTGIDMIRVGFNIAENGLASGHFIYIDKIEILPVETEETTSPTSEPTTASPTTENPTTTSPATTTAQPTTQATVASTTAKPRENMVFDFSKGDNGFRGAGNPLCNQVVYSSSEKAMQGNMLAPWGSVVFEKVFDKPFNGGDYQTVKVTLKNPTPIDIKCRIIFATTDDKDIVNDASAGIDFVVPANSGYKDYYLQIGENAKWKNAKNIDLLWVQTCMDTMTQGQAVYLKKVVYFVDKTTAQTDKGDYNTPGGKSPSTGLNDIIAPLAYALVISLAVIALCVVYKRKRITE